MRLNVSCNFSRKLCYEQIRFMNTFECPERMKLKKFQTGGVAASTLNFPQFPIRITKKLNLM